MPSIPKAKPVGKTDTELAAEQIVKEEAKRTTYELRQTVKALMKEREELKFRNEWFENLEQTPDPKPYRIARRKGQGKSQTPATFCAMASDWHLEERVRPETVGRVNEYNPDISQERAERYTKHTLKLLGLNRGAWDIRGMVQWLGGDFITGHLHLEAVQENYLSPTEASLLAFDVLRAHFNTLLTTDLESITVVCNYGNHGRLTDKPQPSIGLNNLETMLYHLLARWYETEDRLQFVISAGYQVTTEIYGYRVRWHHGDEVKYRGGLGGITVPFYGRTGRQAQGGDLADLDVIGHHHSLQHPKKLMINGSLIGPNPYSVSKGFPPEPPLQGSFVVDEEHRTNFWPITVVDK